ncbi:MAG TPA: N-acetyl-gamma-glutamyl-phosphate reductase [Clostridia bacterium]|nr:N-acetyl-gamma-glutamyl-phosphate reductase [Clostridia bacterium]
MDKVRVSIIGATGYAGVELVRILALHPEVEIVGITSDSYEGKSIQEVFPHLRPLGHRLPPKLLGHQADEALKEADVIFTSLPHGHAMGIARKVVEAGKYMIDLGADFRLKDAGSYRAWYGLEHACPDLLERAVYGLPEVRRDEIRRLGEKAGGIVANPGCYPTSVILGLAPLARSGLAPKRGIIVDSKSGVSGAGRGVSLKTHFCEVNENISAYSVGGTHRHVPEIERELSSLAGENVTISFTPHLCSMIRGILSTIYVPMDSTSPPVPEPRHGDRHQLGEYLRDSTVAASELEYRILELYRDFYKDAPFIDVLGTGNAASGAEAGTSQRADIQGPPEAPETKDVLGSNLCRIGLKFDSRTSTLVVVSVIDNLVKGAAGQAVQNMNVLMGFPETEGLSPVPIYP